MWYRASRDLTSKPSSESINHTHFFQFVMGLVLRGMIPWVMIWSCAVLDRNRTAMSYGLLIDARWVAFIGMPWLTWDYCETYNTM